MVFTTERFLEVAIESWPESYKYIYIYRIHFDLRLSDFDSV